jgi:hypothetical protein
MGTRSMDRLRRQLLRQLRQSMRTSARARKSRRRLFAVPARAIAKGGRSGWKRSRRAWRSGARLAWKAIAAARYTAWRIGYVLWRVPPARLTRKIYRREAKRFRTALPRFIARLYQWHGHLVLAIMTLLYAVIARLPLRPSHRWSLSERAARILPKLLITPPPKRRISGLCSPLGGIHLKESGFTYEQSFQGPWGKLRYYHALELGRQKKKLTWEEYALVAMAVPLNVPYVYVALHLQPERTTSSLGGVFADQYLVIDMLARMVPAGWRVYVKEHPSQFYPPFCGERSRHADFYREVSALPNVTLVSLSVSTFDLIDNARAVATVTGTVGWEAVLRGRPALVFGSAWYRHCDGVWFVPTEAALRAAFDAIEGGARPDYRRIRLYMLALHQVCARAGLGYGTPDEAELGLPHEQTIERLSALLKRYWEHMQTHPLPAAGAPRERYQFPVGVEVGR